MIDLDSFVESNRFTISVIFPVFGAILFIASKEFLGPPFQFNPFLILLGTVVMRLPLIVGLFPVLDRRMLMGISAAVVFTYLIEIYAVRSNIPYGEFSYLIDLGPMFFDVPVALPFFYLPLMLNSFILALLYERDSVINHFVFTVSLVIFIDLVLDPAAVSLGIWEYTESEFYGVPVMNFFGWIFTTSIVYILIVRSISFKNIRKRAEECTFILDDMASFIILWGIVNLYFLNLVPLIFSLILLFSLAKLDRFDFVIKNF